jgi:hypothetical protein
VSVKKGIAQIGDECKFVENSGPIPGTKKSVVRFVVKKYSPGITWNSKA